MARILTNKNICAIPVIGGLDNKKAAYFSKLLKTKPGAGKPMIFSQPRMARILTNKNIRAIRVIGGLDNKKQLIEVSCLKQNPEPANQ